MCNTYTYNAFGLTIASDIEIPEFISSKGQADICIHFGKLPKKIKNPTKVGIRFQIKPDYYLMHRDHVARYMVSSGREIVIDRLPGAKNKDIRFFLLRSVFGVLLLQRGLLPLHASAIKVGEECVVFCGASGQGKSTIAQAFIKRGYQLLTDDICVIAADSTGVPTAYPSYPQLKLWEDTLLETDEMPSSYERVRSVLHKYAVPAAEYFYNHILPVKKIYILSPHKKTTVDLTAITGIEKFTTLKFQTYRHKFMKSLGIEDMHFKTAGIICNQITLQTASRPVTPFLLEEFANLLENDFLNPPDDLN